MSSRLLKKKKQVVTSEWYERVGLDPFSSSLEEPLRPELVRVRVELLQVVGGVQRDLDAHALPHQHPWDNLRGVGEGRHTVI